MHRPLFFGLGLVEAVAATALFVLGFGLPSPDDVQTSFDGARRVTAASRDQVRVIREQVADGDRGNRHCPDGGSG